MEGNKRVYSKPDLTVMYYTPSDSVMDCTYTTPYGSYCYLGGQSSEAFSGNYYIGTYTDGNQYIIWYDNSSITTIPSQTLINQWQPVISYIYNSKTGNTLSSTQGWHIADYNSGGWSGNAS